MLKYYKYTKYDKYILLYDTEELYGPTTTLKKFL